MKINTPCNSSNKKDHLRTRTEIRTNPYLETIGKSHNSLDACLVCMHDGHLRDVAPTNSALKERTPMRYIHRHLLSNTLIKIRVHSQECILMSSMILVKRRAITHLESDSLVNSGELLHKQSLLQRKCVQLRKWRGVQGRIL